MELRECAVRMHRASEPKPVIRRMSEELTIGDRSDRSVPAATLPTGKTDRSLQLFANLSV